MLTANRIQGCFEPKPRIVLSNSGDIISGTEFIEIETPRFGSFDVGIGAFSISWVLGPLRVRHGGGRTFHVAERRPVLRSSGHSDYGEWEGIERSLLLMLPSPVIENALHCSSAVLEKAAPTDELLTKIEHYMRLIRADVAVRSPAGPTILEALTSGLLGAIFPGDNRSLDSQRTSDHRKLRTMVDYIEANLRQDLRLQEVARHADLSVRHMSRIFRTSTGLAPHEYIVRARVQRATELIRRGELGLSAVAAAVGFSSHAHMTASFRRMLGGTPSQFRNI